MGQQVHENKFTYVFLVFIMNFYVMSYYTFCNSNSQLVLLKIAINMAHIIKYESIQKKFKKLYSYKNNFYSWVNWLWI